MRYEGTLLQSSAFPRLSSQMKGVKMAELVVKYMPTDDLIPYANNPRRNDTAVDKVANSIKEFGFRVPIVVDADNVIVAGHTRLKAAKKLGLKSVPCVVADDLTEDQIKAYRLADNKVSELAEWDFELLDLELDDIELDMSQFGFEEDIDDFDSAQREGTGSLAERFLVPPFSVIYTNRGDWIARKRKWMDFGVRSDLGRGGISHTQ